MKAVETIEVAKNLLENYALCDHCLGRQFAMLGHGLTNYERGNAVKLLLIVEGNRLALDGNEDGKKILTSVSENGFSSVAKKTLEAIGVVAEEKREKRKKSCYICKGAFEHVEELAREVVKKFSEYEYEAFLIGVKIPIDIEEREDDLRARFNIRWGESIKNELSREIGKAVAEITGKTVEHKSADVTAIVNPATKQIIIEVNPLFVAGRYRKLARGIPQSRWTCSKCKGRGCSDCNWTGRKYADSIEELIVTKIKERFNGVDAKLHAAGREDVDVRMLGSGRPFIAEVKNPKIRKSDLDSLLSEVNNNAEGKIEVTDLKYSSRESIRRLKDEGQAVKVYRAVVEFERDVSNEELSLLKEGLDGKEVHQETPLRVMHRRSLKVRKKRLYGVEFKRLKSNLVEMLVRCQGGLYIKELINGDVGRTNPSIAELLSISAKCIELDVMDVCLEVD